MVGFVLLFSPLILLILWLGYARWHGRVDSQDWEQSPAGFAQYNLDHLMAVSGGVAMSLLIGAFTVNDGYIATAVIAMIRGSVCAIIGMGVLIMLLRSMHGLKPKLIVYAVVMLLVWLCFSRDDEAESTRVAAVDPTVTLLR